MNYRKTAAVLTLILLLTGFVTAHNGTNHTETQQDTGQNNYYGISYSDMELFTMSGLVILVYGLLIYAIFFYHPE